MTLSTHIARRAALAALCSFAMAGSLLATLTTPRAFRIGTRAATVRWPVPTRLRSRRLRFCVVASDPAGNRSRPACASFLRVR